MSGLLPIIWRSRSRHIALCVAIAFATALAHAQEAPTRLLDRRPFDRVTLNAANGNEAIDTLLLELPNRQIPNPFPDGGSLQLRRLSEPSVLYSVPWTSIARIELFEQLLLGEAVTLANKRKLAESYEYLQFLHKNYPSLAGLDVATAKYLRQDALAAYEQKNYEETLTILLSLYDLDPRSRGLKRFVETVTDRLISQHLAARDFATARSALDLLSEGFPNLGLTNITTWRDKFEKGAARQLNQAQTALEAERYQDARQALRRALAILPSASGAEEMLNEIDRRSPQIVVAVDQLVTEPASSLDWSTTRVSQLTDPKLLNLTGFGAEGGNYACSWASLATDDSGTQLELKLNEAALREGMTAEVVALELLRQADPVDPRYRADFAGLLDNVEIRQGNFIQLHWQRSHVRPESLIPLALRSLIPLDQTPGSYVPSLDKENEERVTYQSVREPDQGNGPEIIVEQFYDNEEVAFADLLSGEVDVIARVPPWQVARLQQTNGVAVAPYRLPTVHVLLPNYKKPLMGRREFRRAVCYGIDRGQILDNILLGGERRPGFRVLSAPLPAGITLTDPVGYAYNQRLQPRPYEPRLAAVLATVARNSLAKLAAMKAQASATQSDDTAAASDSADAPEDTKAAKKMADPLVLAHPPNPTATTVCQTIALQLGAIGIPVKLVPLSPQGTDTEADYDLRYAELAIWEPIVDARKLLGPQGLAGRCSSPMSLALRDVDQARNWKEVRSRLQEVHQIAFNDLPVIPLWQTVDFFAYRQTMAGIGETPVTLYQNVGDWRRMLRGGRR